MSYKNAIANFFGNAATAVKAKLAELNPINRFIKFSLEQIFQELIKDQQISYESLVSGIISLPNLELDTEKINKKYLFTSPYTLNSGKIGHLKIILPSFVQLDKQNIEVEIKRIQLQFQPIEKFEENFKKIMEEIQQFLYHFVGEKVSEQFLVEKGSHDYFRETLRELLVNMKIRIEEIAILVHFQNPVPEAKINPDMLLKIPLINIHRGADTLKGQKNQFEEINFDCQIPQLTFHLMNSKQPKRQDFPFSNPQPDDASAVLKFGAKNFKEINIEVAENIPRLNISIWKSIQKAEKKTKLSFNFPQLEVMFDPSQIKILILFAKQITEFSHCLINVKKQFGLENDENNTEVLVPTMNRKQSIEKKNANVFTSMSISFLESSVLNFSKVVPKVANNDIFTSIIEKNQLSNGDLFKSINEFYNVVGQSINQGQVLNSQQQSLIEQLQMINFKQIIEVKASISSITLCVQKYNVEQEVKSNLVKGENIVNLRVPNSYFALKIKTALFHLREDKSTELSFSEITLDHVKYRREKKNYQEKAPSNKEEDEFCDLRNSVHFYSEAFLSMKEQKLLDHFCVEEILQISRSPSEPKSSQFVKRYNFLTHLKTSTDNQLYKPGFIFNSYPSNSPHNHHKYPVNKIDLMNVSLTINTEIAKEVLDIYFLLQKELSIFQKQNSQNSLNNQAQRQEKNIQEKQKTKSNNLFFLTFRSFNFAFFDISLNKFTSSVEKYMNSEVQKFQHCFCNTNTQGVYITFQALNLSRNKDSAKFSLNSFDLGLIYIQNSSVSQIKPILRMIKTLHEKDLEQCFELKIRLSKISVVFPEINLQINSKQSLQLLELIYKQLESLKQQFPKILKSLKSLKKDHAKQAKINQSSQISQSQQKIQLFIERFHLKCLNMQVVLQNICIFNHDSSLIVKLNSFILAISDNIEFYASKMVNHKLCLISYPQPRRNLGIKETEIALQFGSESKSLFKTKKQKFDDFFHKLSKSQTSFELTIKNSFAQSSNFKHLKCQKIVQSEKKEIKEAIKTYQLNLSVPINANAMTICWMINEKRKIESSIPKFMSSIQKLIKLAKEIFPSNNQSNIKQQVEPYQFSPPKEVIISLKKILIDIRPTFIQSKVRNSDDQNLKKQPQKLVFSNTRSFLSVNLEKLNIFTKEQKTYIEGVFNIDYYFKTPKITFSQEPIHINENKYKDFGFEKIFKIQKIHVIVQIIEPKIVETKNINEKCYENRPQANKNLSKKIRLNVSLKCIEGLLNLKAQAWLSLHCKHFISHNVKRNFGLTLQEYEDQTVHLRSEDFDFSQQKDQVVNLNDGAKIYTEKDKRKKYLEKSFLEKPFAQPELDQKCELYIETFGVQDIILKLTNKQEYEANVEVNLKELNLSAKVPDLSNFSIELLGNVNELKIIHENKKPQNVGFFGGLSNKFYENSYGKFPLLESHNPLKFKLQKDHDRTYLKFDRCDLNLGFRSVILELTSAYQAFKNEINQSGWKKIYEEQKLSSKSHQNDSAKPLTLISIPQNTMYVSLIYDWCSVLSNQKIEAPEFLLHQESDKIDKIDESVVGWVKNILLNNVSGLVGGFVIDKFNLIVHQIVQLISFLLSCIF